MSTVFEGISRPVWDGFEESSSLQTQGHLIHSCRKLAQKSYFRVRREICVIINRCNWDDEGKVWWYDGMIVFTNVQMYMMYDIWWYMMIFTNVHIYMFGPCFAVKGKPSCFKLVLVVKVTKRGGFFILVLKGFSFETIDQKGVLICPHFPLLQSTSLLPPLAEIYFFAWF